MEFRIALSVNHSFPDTAPWPVRPGKTFRVKFPALEVVGKTIAKVNPFFLMSSDICLAKAATLGSVAGSPLNLLKACEYWDVSKLKPSGCVISTLELVPWASAAKTESSKAHIQNTMEDGR